MLQKQSTIPIYQQIIEYFETEIGSGRLKAGERIDSIRSLALKFKVNPNTVQKSLNELETCDFRRGRSFAKSLSCVEKK